MKKKVALVGGGEIGDAIAEALLRTGKYDVARSSRSSEPTQFRADWSDPVSFQAMVLNVKQELGGLDMIVQTAAKYPTPTPLQKVDVNSARDEVASSTAIALNIAKAASVHGIQRVVWVSTLGALRNWELPGRAVYSAGKQGAAGVFGVLAKELGEGSRVIEIAPGLVQTAMGERVKESDPEFANAPSVTPDEVAALVVELVDAKESPGGPVLIYRGPESDEVVQEVYVTSTRPLDLTRL